MTKTIKFNIIVDSKPIRDLEGLRENFNIDDIYSLYERRVLHRWLEVRGFDEHLKKVGAIKSVDEIEITKSLISIFGVKEDNEGIKKSVYAIQSRKEEKLLLGKLEKLSFSKMEVIKSYFSGYDNLLRDIIEKKEDFAFIKNSIKIIGKDYYVIFKYRYIDFYYQMIAQAPLAIFSVLMHQALRKYYIAEEVDHEILSVFNEKLKKLLKIEYSQTELISFRLDDNSEDLMKDKTYLNNHFKMFGGVTDGYWKDIPETKEKKIMLIHVKNGNFVRSCGKNGEELTEKDVFLKFPIVNGVDYKSNSDYAKLIYMEV